VTDWLFFIIVRFLGFINTETLDWVDIVGNWKGRSLPVLLVSVRCSFFTEEQRNKPQN
jgi:hypothetical protein